MKFLNGNIIKKGRKEINFTAPVLVLSILQSGMILERVTIQLFILSLRRLSTDRTVKIHRNISNGAVSGLLHKIYYIIRGNFDLKNTFSFLDLVIPVNTVYQTIHGFDSTTVTSSGRSTTCYLFLIEYFDRPW